MINHKLAKREYYFYAVLLSYGISVWDCGHQWVLFLSPDYSWKNAEQ